jgi:hypothetical protein
MLQVVFVFFLRTEIETHLRELRCGPHTAAGHLALPAGAAGLRVPVWCRFESRIDVVPPALVAEPETLPQYQQCSLGRIGLSRLLGDTFLESGGVCVGNDCEHHSAGSVSP